MRDGALRGRQIVLRDWIMEDMVPFAHWLQPGHMWKELDAPYYALPPPENVQAMIAGYRDAIIHNDWPTPRTELVIAVASSNRMIGQVTQRWVSEETLWPEIGIVIYDPDCWGKGKGYEALQLWCNYLWASHPNVIRLDLRTWSGNVGMMKLAQKLGFKEEARFRKARIVNDEYFDGLGYGVLREEWQARYPNESGDMK